MSKRRSKARPTSGTVIKPPSVVKVGYQDFNLSYEGPSHDNRGHFGITNLIKSNINVVHTGNKIEDVNTLIHEVLHAIVYTQGIKLEHDTEELVVNSMANGLVGVIRENPALMNYILGQLGMLG